MRAITYWIAQFLVAAVSMFAILLVIDLASGTALATSWQLSAAYALGAAAVFTATRYSRARRS